jgi:transposase-like protein
MKTAEEKLSFIEKRGQGKSYAVISKELSLSKDTCSKWEQELKEEIATYKGEQLQELYNTYYMTKEARIKKIGDTLTRIEASLQEKDLSELTADKLLDYKLKYMEALKAEYIETSTTPINSNYNSKDILLTLADLFNRTRQGQTSPEQATRENLILSNILRAYEATTLEEKLKQIETTLKGRN